MLWGLLRRPSRWNHLTTCGVRQRSHSSDLEPERERIESFQYRRYHEAYPWCALASFVFLVSALALEATVWRRCVSFATLMYDRILLRRGL